MGCNWVGLGKRTRTTALLAAAGLISSLPACFTTEQGDPPGVTRETRAVGSACDWNVQCASELCLPEQVSGDPTGWKDGNCTALCPDLQCAGTDICVQMSDVGYCLPPCGLTGQSCRSGYVCNPGIRACLPDCRGGWDCGPNAECNAQTGLCELGVTGEPVGSPCEVASDCASSICLTETDDGQATGWQDGMCSTPCADGQCEAGQSCVRLGERMFCLPECTDQCRPGYVCSDYLAACLPNCQAGWDCGDGYDCGDDGQCHSQIPDLAAVGQPCTHDNQCETGICFPENNAAGPTGWRGGTCAGVCGNALCGSDSACTTIEGISWCVAGCTPPSACREGYVCGSTSAACLPDCRLGWTCGSLSCSEQTGECEVPVVPDNGRALGQSCSEHAQCASNTCLLHPQSSWNNGICTQACSGSCPTSFECATVAGLATYCLPACGQGQICPTGYTCDLFGDACVPDCLSGWSCLVGSCRASGLCRTGGGPGPGGG